MHKICLRFAALAALLCLAPIAQAAVLGSQPDSSVRLDLAWPASPAIPSWTGSAKSFDLYLGLSGLDSATGNAPDFGRSTVSDTAFIAFGGGCSGGQSFDSSYAIPLDSASTTAAAPALIHFIPDSPLVGDGSACTILIEEETGFQNNRADSTLNYALLGDTSGNPYFVAYDTAGTPPALASVSIASGNASTSAAKAGDTVTLTFTAETPDVPLETPVVTIGAHTASVATSTSGGASATFIATTTLDGSDAEGALSFSIDTANRYGDAGFTTSTTTDGSLVVVDNTSPALAEAAAIGTTTDATPGYGFTTTEAGTIAYGGSCSSATTSAVAPTTTVTLASLAAGTYADCTLTVTDAAGNASAPLSFTPFTIEAAPSPTPGQGGNDNGPPISLPQGVPFGIERGATTTALEHAAEEAKEHIEQALPPVPAQSPTSTPHTPDIAKPVKPQKPAKPKKPALKAPAAHSQSNAPASTAKQQEESAAPAPATSAPAANQPAVPWWKRLGIWLSGYLR